MIKWLRTVGLTTLLMLPIALSALSLNQAQTDGLVGERPDGYIGSVTANPSSEVMALVEEINSKRREKYLGISRKHGQSLTTVEALAGKMTRAKIKPGEYYMNDQGYWNQK